MTLKIYKKAMIPIFFSIHNSQKKLFTILCITLFISDLHITDDLAPCSICLSSFVVMDTSSHLPCNHLFHLHCIQAWLAKVRSTVGTQNNLNLCFDKTILSWSYLENYLNTKVELFFKKIQGFLLLYWLSTVSI